ncbi:MAG TPA: DNA ligase D, partial [Candidatus Angelobacter sp.]|nr:DNA ligase D [Candidatus Angelobacter sp.]
MSLEEYRRKRVFSQTPEPPDKPSDIDGNRFFIQRHSARRLHYDLRLEMEGVLKSWALPNGPTLDPAIKRLAVHVEDHPLDYGSFEGTIPSGNYGAGNVTLWDRGTYEWVGPKTPAQMWESGDLKLRFHGHKIVGEFALVRTNRGKGKDWLLIKKKDFAVRQGWDPESDIRSVLQGPAELSSIEGAVKAAMPSSLEPMLATLSSTVPSGTDWLYEVKWDGYRSLCYIEKAKVHMLSRRGIKLEKQFAAVAEALSQCVKADAAIIDGEVVALDENGTPSFQRLQGMTGFGPKPPVKGVAAPLLNFFAFDLLYLNGYDLRKAALIDRRNLLISILLPSETVRYSEHFAGKGSELLEAVKAKGLEGILAKQAQSRYESRRSTSWIKIKVTCQQDFVVCGYLLGEREPFGALVLGYYHEKKLVYAGNVGSGFTQQSLKAVFEKIKPLIVKKATLSDVPRDVGEVTWTKPELVCTVKFTSWTHDNRLRAPVFLGLRDDADPKDVVRETGLAAEDLPVPELHAQATQSPKEKAAEAETPDSSIPKDLLLPPENVEAALTIDGRRLKFTNLNKVYYPADGYTKRDLINFYAAVADLLVPHLQGRPLSLKRYPNGIGQDYFFQKDASGFPDWLHREEISGEEEGAKVRVICDDKPSLLYLANLGCIDQNPYMARLGSLDNPDFILIDLDPYHCGYDRIVEAAQLVRQKLQLIGLVGYPKTTGGNGMHVYVPVEPIYEFAQTRSFAEILARWVAAERPDLFTTPRMVSAREKGKVYFDYLQNASRKTISAPYVLRAHPGAPVATPLKWDEIVPGLRPAQFHIANVLRRFDRVGDLFAGVLNKPQELAPALEKLAKAMG